MATNANTIVGELNAALVMLCFSDERADFRSTRHWAVFAQPWPVGDASGFFRAQLRVIPQTPESRALGSVHLTLRQNKVIFLASGPTTGRGDAWFPRLPNGEYRGQFALAANLAEHGGSRGDQSKIDLKGILGSLGFWKGLASAAGVYILASLLGTSAEGVSQAMAPPKTNTDSDDLEKPEPLTAYLTDRPIAVTVEATKSDRTRLTFSTRDRKQTTRSLYVSMGEIKEQVVWNGSADGLSWAGTVDVDLPVKKVARLICALCVVDADRE